MELIERYLYSVKKYLPEEVREDVEMELRANIEAMLPDNYTEDDVYQVLKNLGNPIKLASEYNTKKRYLIGPGYYEKYISVLQKVITICVAVAMGIALFTWLVDLPTEWYQIPVFARLIASLISSGIAGAIQAIFWVTIVFVILERTGVDEGVNSYAKDWKPDDLPELPIDDNKISRAESVFSLFVTILFTACVYLRPQLIAIYLSGGTDGVSVFPIFNMERLRIYVPLILALALFELGMFVWKFVRESWSPSMAIANAIQNLGLCVLVVFMLADISLINAEISSIVGESFSTVSNWLSTSKLIFGVVFVGINVWDSISVLLKSMRKPA